MNLIELRKILEMKKYPQGFIEDIMLFYPMMTKYFGETEIDLFLKEWNFVFFEQLGPSGNADREKKQINVNLYFADEYWDERLITALFHETGHALGTLCMDSHDLLSQGHERESFFEKMDEAVVSDFADDILFGQLSYGYYESHLSFKCRGGMNCWHKYPFEKLFYNVFKILLGAKRDLIVKLMRENDEVEKSQIYEMIKEELKNTLSEEEFEILVDSCAILILKHGYGETMEQTSANQRITEYLRGIYDYNFKQLKSGEEENFRKDFSRYVKEFYNKHWKKIIEYAQKRHLSDSDIFSQSDKLCSMFVDYLVRKVNESECIDFATIKVICEYLVKINNKSVNLDKTNILINALFSYLNKLSISFDSKIEQMFSQQELLCIIAKIIVLNGFKLEMLNSMAIMKVMEDGTIYLKCGELIIKLSRRNINDKTYDSCLGEIDVNTVLPQVRLNLYDKTIGDANADFELVDNDRLFCCVNLDDLKEKQNA